MPESSDTSIDQIIEPLFRGDLDAAYEALLDLIDAHAADPDRLGELARELAGRVDVPAASVVFGPGCLVWGDPHRGDWAWRCGCCPWTASNYKTEGGGRRSAERHLAEHPGATLVLPSLRGVRAA